MTSNLLIFGGIAFVYIILVTIFFNYVSSIEEEDGRQKAQNIFITVNILLLCGAMAYAYVKFANI